jgi:hypothetical protein
MKIRNFKSQCGTLHFLLELVVTELLTFLRAAAQNLPTVYSKRLPKSFVAICSG